MPILVANLLLNTLYAIFFSLLKAGKKRKTTLYLAVSSVQLIFICAFIDPESVPDLSDWSGYVTEFQDLAAGDAKEFWYYFLSVRYEPLYLLYVKTCSLVSSNYHFFLGLSALPLTISLCSVIKRYSVNPYISMILYILVFFTGSLYILRQYMSVAFVMLSIDSIKNRKKWSFLFYSAIAVFFHYSSIVWIPMYFLYSYVSNKERVLLFSIGVIVCTVLISFYSSFIVTIVR